MKNLFITLLIFIGMINLEGQTSKIKVYLLGTFHFAQTEKLYNVLDGEHQKEINKLNDIVVKLSSDKIFVERMPEFEYMNKMDSLYTVLANTKQEIVNPNEIYQVGFKVAMRLGHKKVFACDSPGKFGMLYKEIKNYAALNNQTEFLSYKKYGETEPLTSRINSDSLRTKIPLLDYIKFLNSNAVQASSQASYVNMYTRIGQTNVYKSSENYLLGTELVADWYRRNIYIYSKILNQIDYSEKSIFIIIGNDHVPILNHLFQSNPFFEVINTDKWLGKSKVKSLKEIKK